ncbi:hypothetical protein [Ruminococcus sp. NK3A76]|uniref:hypothetical protein n=1 Tax=Ruminococcus sp. NK3A76 TaxID=877411 RepID=UPI00048F027F|nr:hypothetical protein [Ruminococcus sp. NK3A76]
MRQYEQLNRLGQEEIARIEGIFNDQRAFRRMPENERISLMKDYMYLSAKNHPGHTDDNDRRIFSEIRSNAGIEKTFGKLLKASPSGKGIIDELKTDLLVEYAAGRNLLGKKDVADRLANYERFLDRGQRGLDELYAQRQEQEKNRLAREQRQREVDNYRGPVVDQDELASFDDILAHESVKVAEDTEQAREQEQQRLQQEEQARQLEEQRRQQEQQARQLEEQRRQQEQQRLREENERRITRTNRRIAYDEQHRKSLQAQIDNITRVTELEAQFNDQQSFEKLSNKQKRTLFGDYLRAVAMSDPEYRADMEKTLNDAISLVIFDELLGQVADKVKVGSDCLKELGSDYIRKQAFRDTLVPFDAGATTYEEDAEYTAHLDSYAGVTAERETLAKLNSLTNSGRYDEAAEILTDIFSTADVTDTKNTQMQAAQQFLDGLFAMGGSMSAIENSQAVLGIASAVAKKQADIQIAAGKKIDEIQHSIYLHEVDGTELIADDKRLSRMVAHDLMLKQEPEGIRAAGAAALMGAINAKCDSRTIDGKSALSVISEARKKAVSQELDEKYSDINSAKRKQYIMETGNCTMFENETGFRIRRDKLKEGESRFSKLPEDITRINGKGTLTELDEHERDLTSKLNEENKFIEAVRLTAQKAALLLKDLEATAKSRGNSESYTKLHDALENYSKLGNGFKFKNPSGTIKITDKIDERTANKAIEDLSAAASLYESEHTGLGNMFKGLSGSGGERLKVSRLANELANSSRKEFSLYEHCDKEATERELELVKRAKYERGIADNDKKTIESRLTSNLRKSLKELEAAKTVKKFGGDKYQQMSEQLSDFISDFEDFGNMPERLTDQSKLDYINRMNRKCREFIGVLDDYLDRKVSQGKVTKDGKITADAGSAERIKSVIKTYSVVMNIMQYLGSYKAAVRNNKSSSAFDLRSKINQRKYELREQTENLEGVDKTAAENAYDKCYDVAKKYSSLDDVKYEQTGLSRSQKEEVIECMASMMVNDYIKTDIGKKMLHDKLPKAPNEYDGFIKSIARSEAFRKNLPKVIDKIAVNTFLSDKQASLKLADKFMHEMAVDKKNAPAQPQRNTQPTVKAEVGKAL